MKGSKNKAKTDLNDEKLDKKLLELGNKMRGVEVVEQRKSKNVFSKLSDKSNNVATKKEESKNGDGFKWETETYPKKVEAVKQSD